MLGITGPPGAGKSTLCDALVARLGPRAVAVPMDGFHLGDALLVQLGLRERKGAPETFDEAGFALALRRLRAADEVVYAPRFDRALEDSVAAAIRVVPDVPLVITEGNYLLHWPSCRAALDEIWYLDSPVGARRERLVQRHIDFGKSRDDARRFALESDERNAMLIAAGRGLADLIVPDAVLAGLAAER